MNGIRRLTCQLRVSLLTILLSGLLSLGVDAQSSQGTQTTGTFILHKFQQAIGKETYTLVKAADSLIIRSSFGFTDRGRDVPLETTIVTDLSGNPIYFKTNGNTSRSSVIDSEVRIKNGIVRILLHQINSGGISGRVQSDAINREFIPNLIV